MVCAHTQTAEMQRVVVDTLAVELQLLVMLVRPIVDNCGVATELVVVDSQSVEMASMVCVSARVVGMQVVVVDILAVELQLPVMLVFAILLSLLSILVASLKVVSFYYLYPISSELIWCYCSSFLLAYMRLLL